MVPKHPHTCYAVIDTESVPPQVVGEFVHSDEDVIVYRDASGEDRRAPEDCVTVRAITVKP